MGLFQPTSNAHFMTLGAIGLAVNILVLAASLELIRRGIRLAQRRWVSHA